MLKNNLKTAWRNLLKNKFFSAINIFGLAIGVAAFLLIVNYLRFEYSYDDTQVNKDRIFRVPMKLAEKDGKVQTFAFTYPAVAPAMKKDFPEIEEAIRFRRRGGIVKYGENKFVENGSIYYTDPEIFKVFTYQFIAGNAETAFQELNDAVITKETATKYFGSEDPIGKALNYGNENYVVKAIIQDIPLNAHLQFNILLNYKKYIQLTNGRANTSWGWSDFYTYILLLPGTDPASLQSKMPAFAQRYMGKDMAEKGFTQSFDIQPIKDIHLKSDYDYELAGNGNLSYLKYLAMAALFILFIAWINYINLATARSIDRSKEVGVRKVIGAKKSQLITQFITESFMINALAILLGMCIFLISLRPFSTLIEKDISNLKIADSGFWMLSGIIFILGSLAAAFYPAFVLSSFQPIQSIKSSGLSIGKDTLRKSLVIFQFASAILLISGAIAIYKQLHYMMRFDLGVDIQQTLVLQQNARQDSSDIPNFHAFMNEMESNPAVVSATASTSVPGSEVGGSSDYSLKNSTLGKRCRVLGIDNKFIPSYGLTLIAGRNFSTDNPEPDSSSFLHVIVNETATKIFGFKKPEEMINQEITDGESKCMVVGILKDFHQESLQFDFDPIVFYPSAETNFGFISLKLNTKDMASLMPVVKEKWSAYFPESPYNYFFLNDRFDSQYKNERLFSSVLWIFTIIGVIVACLGLLGLSYYSISKRMKEISIRRVLGASLIQLTILITKDYFKLVLLAGFISIPVGYLLLSNWLAKYAFHIPIGLWFFLFPLLLIVSIALLTVLFQSVKAALANPVTNLRSE